MKGDIRRQGILRRLSETEGAVSASVLSREFGVSRQSIVKDIAKLKAEGAYIISLSRGYVLDKGTLYKRVFKTVHSDEEVAKELTLIVELGGTVEDVFIFHRFYNKVSAKLNIQTKQDVKNFLEKVQTGTSSLLKNVTSGYHYHTVSARDTGTLDIIGDALQKAGFLAPLQEYEPDEMQVP